MSDNKEQMPISYEAHEADMTRADTMHRRLLKIIILLIVLLAASNLAWLIAWRTYDFNNYQIEQDGEGVNIVGDGDKEIYIGTDVPHTTPETDISEVSA